MPRVKRFLSEVKEGIVPQTLWTHSEVGHTQEAKKEILELLDFAKPQDVFSTPKPTRLLDRILQIGCDAKGIVLDIFAGSGTTGHAVLKANAADGGTRRFILVSNSEATAEEPEKNLCRDVCAERVRRVAQGYPKADGTAVAGLGGGFAYLRSRRVPVSELLDLDHPAVWTALQLRHLEGLAPYDAAAPFQWAEEGDTSLCYVPRFRQEDLAALRERVDAAGAVVVYSWQPGLLRQHLRRPLVTHEALPTGLSRPFGLRL
jgi:adenine-specific DNA-methyltransferase